MGAPLRAEHFQPVQPYVAPDLEEEARRIIGRIVRLLEHAENARVLSSEDRRWFSAPPMLPDHADVVRRARRVVNMVSTPPPRVCKERGCGALVYLVRTRSRTTWVVDPLGGPHQATCGKRGTS